MSKTIDFRLINEDVVVVIIDGVQYAVNLRANVCECGAFGSCEHRIAARTYIKSLQEG